MALPAVGSANYPTPKELLNQILSDLRFSFAKDGLVVNVLPGSDHYKRAEILANRLAIAIANNKVAVLNFSPLTATGDSLTDLAGVFGVTRRPASQAAGYAYVYGSSGSVTIPLDYLATASNGLKYKTTQSNTVTLDDTDPPAIELISVSSGSETNLDAGTQLTWDSAAVGALNPKLVVDPGEIDGGADADDDERLRTRLLRKLRSPGVGGNAAKVAEWAEESTASVEAAYVYPAIRGPGSYDIAVTKAGGDRTLSTSTIATVAAYVAAQMPGFADLNVTAVDVEEVDVVIDMILPDPVSAGGSGGGWIDASPWPSDADSAVVGQPVKITAVGTNQITVNDISVTPTVGKHFSIWNPDAGEMVEFEITAVGGALGAHTITVSALPSWVTTGMYVSSAAVNLNAYAQDFLAEMEALGPGEKSESLDLIPRGRRFPKRDGANQYILTNTHLGNVAAKHDEIIEIRYAIRNATGTTTELIAPSMPTNTADPPKILVLKHLAIRNA